MYNTALLLLAAALLVVIGVMHSYLGERLILRRLFTLNNLPLLQNDRSLTERILRYAWHLTSLAWWGFSALLLVMAFGAANPATLGAVLGATFVLNGVVILAVIGIRHPAWALFVMAGVATWNATW